MNYILLISTVITAVKEIEKLMPASAGKDKLDAAIALISGVLDNVQPLIPQITGTISTIVKMLNSTGVFVSKSS